ncbi:MAG: hypothetical protein ABJI45_06950 [Paracoccaceae bacterium]
MANDKKQRALDRTSLHLYLTLMTLVFDLDDRARLRERFFGATRAVLART